MTERDRQLIRALQRGLPLVERPYAAIAERTGWTEPEVIARLGEWRASGVLRRICAYIRHREAGYAANGMAVWDVPEERLEAVGGRMAAAAMVSHCYAREKHERFPWRLYTMLHGRSEEEVLAEAARLARQEGIERYRVLFSTRELKRSSMDFFPDDDD
jgi:DNA-binding Lrp family transcriptional regulator